jgi:hypothetical protein
MEKWVPVLWIIGSGIGVFLLFLFIDLLKSMF